MGQKEALNGESSSKGELGFQEQFWQSKDACDCGCEMGGLHHLFIVFKWWSAGPWFWKPYGLGQLFRVFSSFSSLFYIFSSLLGIFAILEEFWILLEEKGVFWPFGGFLDGFMAFWRHFRPFGGFLVGFSGFLREIW